MHFTSILLTNTVLCWCTTITNLCGADVPQIYFKVGHILGKERKDFIAQYGYVKPGDKLMLTVVSDDPDATIKTGEVKTSTPANSWGGGPFLFRANIPDNYAGKHAGEFTGTYVRNTKSGGKAAEDGDSESTAPELVWNGSAEAGVLSIKITKVPRFLYADAKAWVPVSFEFEGVSDAVDLKGQHVDVTFILKGAEQFTFSAPAAPGNGRGIYEKAKSFTAWVDIKEFMTIDIPEDTIKDGVFKVSASIKDDKSKGWVELESDPNKTEIDPEFQNKMMNAVEVFGDSNVEIVEIDYEKGKSENQFHFFKQRTTQTRLHQTGRTSWLQTSLRGFKFNPPREVEMIYKYYSDTFQHGTMWNAYVVSQTEVGRERVVAQLTFTDDDPAIFGDTDGTQQYIGNAYGVTIGCNFGVSYGFCRPRVLKKNVGMDLSVTSGSGHAYIAQDSRITSTIIGTDPGIDNKNYLATAAKGLGFAIGVKAIMCATGWGTLVVLAGEVAGAYDFYQNLAAADGRVSAFGRYSAYLQVIPPGGTSKGFPPTKINDERIMEKSEVFAIDPFKESANREFRVGSTWIYTLVLDATIDTRDDAKSVNSVDVAVQTVFDRPLGKRLDEEGVIGVSITR